jgi:hypothetical protein
VTAFDIADMNTKWYLAAVYANAFAVLFKGFPSAHAMPGFESSQDMLKNSGLEADTVMQELFYIMDVSRIFSSAFRIFPGARIIIQSIMKPEIEEYLSQKRASIFDMVLYYLVCGVKQDGTDSDTMEAVNTFALYIRELTAECGSFPDVVKLLPEARESLDAVFYEAGRKDIASVSAANLSFYSDYSYRTGMDTPPGNDKILAENDESENGENHHKNDDENQKGSKTGYSDSKKTGEEKREKDGRNAVYVYDEWNNETQDYLYDWCHLSEIDSFYMEKSYRAGSVLSKEQVRKVRQVFERLRPELVKKKKNLLTGDEVVLDSLVNYLVEKKAGLYPEEKIYSKDFKDERDIAAALLIDISGSTAENVEGQEVLEIEKSATFLLAEGLRELGDKFGIFGFSGSGRGKCSYYVFKKFEEDWKDEQQQRLIGCRPSSSTRIGVAIRHTVKKLKALDSRRKLIIIITDGKPQDSDGYTTEGLYAQHDVRMSCIEAKRNGIVVFCLSTENNSFEELELMFPVKRYAIMSNITELPRLLAKSYIKLTI